MSRIHAAVRRAAEPSFDDQDDAIAAPDTSNLAGEIATMVRPWEAGPDLSLVDPPIDEPDEPAQAARVEAPPPPVAERRAPEAPPPPVAERRAPEAPPPPPAAFAASTFDEKLVVASNAKLYCVEQYRKLAASLHHAQAERGIRVILVCSALPGEGKTLTAINLALTFSESYRRRVLLIDADLRHPAVHKVFQAPNTEGLNETLRAEHDRSIPILRVSKELSLLPAGAPDTNPMHGLTSPRMKRVVQHGAARFDWVIIDTPPVALLPDAKLLAGMADGVLMVIRAGETSYRPIQRALESVGRERVIGVVLNRVDEGIIAEARYDGYYDGTA
jgi:protein-tyrosine kinase